MYFTVSLLLIVARTCLVLGAPVNTSDMKPLDSRVVGGHDAVPYSRPYMVSLQARLLFVQTHICGGSLLNENWILTAAHCIKTSWIVQWLPLDAVAGAHEVDHFDTRVQIKTISKRIAHPDYDGGIGPHDIAVLRTSTSFQFTDEIRPIQLPNRDFNHKGFNSFLLTGWGALRTTLFFPDLPSRLQEVDVMYIPYKKCYDAIEELRDWYEENPLDKYANICTGLKEGGIAACNGDSGGPLVHFVKGQDENVPNSEEDAYEEKIAKLVNDTNHEIDVDTIEFSRKKPCISYPERNTNEGTPIVIGIVSWGMTPCGEKGAPTVYTKVAPYLDFINRNINF